MTSICPCFMLQHRRINGEAIRREDEQTHSSVSMGKHATAEAALEEKFNVVKRVGGKKSAQNELNRSWNCHCTGRQRPSRNLSWSDTAPIPQAKMTTSDQLVLKGRLKSHRSSTTSFLTPSETDMRGALRVRSSTGRKVLQNKAKMRWEIRIN